MIWSVLVESNRGEVLVARKSDGHSAGKGFVNFITPCELYCLQDLKEDEMSWFRKLDSYMNDQLCQTLRPFLDALYSGNWNYSEDEYEFYRRRNTGLSAEFTEESFKRGLREVQNKWTDIQLIMNGIKNLIHAMKAANYEETYWYEPDYTVKEFEALYETLTLLAERDAEKVRIIIE